MMVAPNVASPAVPSSPSVHDHHIAVKQVGAAAPSTPPPFTSELSLEDRVAELEEKLATLSRLLQRQRSSRVTLHHSPTLPRDVSPSPSTTVPALDSPSPLPYQSQHRRTFSSKILHDESITDLSISAPLLAGSSCDYSSSPSDKVSTGMTQVATTTTATEEPKSIQAKWMDYLNSFQESTPDVDQQMEEFVRVPSQVEALLSFGIIICVDCFLYTLTILPVRAVWSLLLLVIRWTKPQTPEYQFHRRYVRVCMYMFACGSRKCLLRVIHSSQRSHSLNKS